MSADVFLDFIMNIRPCGLCLEEKNLFVFIIIFFVVQIQIE